MWTWIDKHRVWLWIAAAVLFAVNVLMATNGYGGWTPPLSIAIGALAAGPFIASNMLKDKAAKAERAGKPGKSGGRGGRGGGKNSSNAKASRYHQREG